MTYIRSKPKIVLLGMMTQMPVAGVVWQTLHYLVGLHRLGYDVYYVEAHAMNPSMFTEHKSDSGSERAAAFIAGLMRRFDFGDRWAFQALHYDGRCYGMSERQLQDLYQSAELIINLHGGTLPRPEHSATGRLVYLETDPVMMQIELYNGCQESLDFLAQHCAFFTFAENYGHPDCRLPVTGHFTFHPTRQPVVLDFWQPMDDVGERCFTTVGNWRQQRRSVVFQGETYTWSKHHEFLRFLDLPRRTGRVFELALSRYEEEDQRLLEGYGWRVRRALDFSLDLDSYRRYITWSYGEFTVAKDQNVRLRSGWFSDRSATYLASGRPVITQETGLSNVLPTGAGLFAFSTVEDVVWAVEMIDRDYAGHRRAAREVAREYFDANVVLGRLLSEVGV